MTQKTFFHLARIATAFVAASGFANGAWADNNGRAVPLLPQYKQECGACHVAYPPTLMPAASWTRIMANLPKHFGTDASLDTATANELSRWIQAHAGTYKRVSEEPPQDRITLSAWFERKHRKVEPAVWKHASVKSAANCAACHPGADRGDFDEHGLRVPPGLSPSLLRAWND